MYTSLTTLHDEEVQALEDQLRRLEELARVRQMAEFRTTKLNELRKQICDLGGEPCR